MNPTVEPLVCPQCGNSRNVVEKEYKFGAEFRCEVCGTTAILITNQQLYQPHPGDLICVSCGRVSPPNARYCQCGADLQRKCIHCLEEFPVFHTICDHCGWPQDIPVQSREGYILNVQRWIKALSDPDENIQQQAHQQLMDIIHPPDYLMSTFLTGINHYRTVPLIQQVCVQLLARIQPAPADELLDVLDKVTGAEAIEALCQALGNSPERLDRIQPRLLALLDKLPIVWAAYETLYKLGTPHEVLAEKLITILRDSYDGIVRSTACLYLAELYEAAAPAIPLLLETLREDNQARLNALSALIKAGAPERDVIDALVAAYEQDSSEQERRNIIQALGKLGETAVPVLIFLIDREENPDLEKAACHALALIGEAAVPALVNVLKYKQNEPDVHVSACFALGLMKHRAAAAVPTLVNLLNSTDEEPDRQRVYCYALGEIGSADAIPALIRLMKRYERLSQPAWEAVQKALMNIGEPAIPALRDLSNSLFQSKIERDAARNLMEIIQRRS
ncbi:MAG: HEAT repeat domain-containing protein [Anaerolineae bacterium]|nr:HEAT repeat domain-containing protein [Anaerolineae bacterium]